MDDVITEVIFLLMFRQLSYSSPKMAPKCMCDVILSTGVDKKIYSVCGTFIFSCYMKTKILPYQMLIANAKCTRMAAKLEISD